MPRKVEVKQCYAGDREAMEQLPETVHVPTAKRHYRDSRFVSAKAFGLNDPRKE